MKKIKFVILGAIGTENTMDLKNEIENRGHEAELIRMKDVLFEFNFEKQMLDIIYKGKSLSSFDAFIFRGYNKSFAEAQIIAEWLFDRKKVIIDDYLLKKFIPNKIFEAQRFAKFQIPHIQTFQAMEFDGWKTVISQIKFPAVVKPLNSQKGQGIFLVENKDLAIELFEKNPTGYMLQEYVKIDGDIRVFVVGGKAVGAMKRFVPKDDIRSNVSLGAKTERIDLNHDLESISLRASAAMEYEVAGVDVIERDGKYYILEVNIAPQWQGFKEATGVNPAKDIIEYAISKYEKN